MKKELVIVLLLSFAIMFCGIGFVNAGSPCNLKAKIVNQDPYPAVPGEYVKVVFQLDGVANAQCGDIQFNLNSNYPFSIEEGEKNPKIMNSGWFVLNYQNYGLLPYKLRVDDGAIDGENLVSADIYGEKDSVGVVRLYQTFNITVEDTRSDFELSVNDYSYETKKLTLSVLNTGEHDAEAFAIEIPAQDGVEVIGSNRVVIGTVASTQEEIATFDVNLSRSGNVKVDISYNDKNNIRRKMEKTFYFDENLFKRKIVPKSSWSWTNTIISVISISVIVFFVYKYWKKKRDKKSLRR